MSDLMPLAFISSPYASNTVFPKHLATNHVIYLNLRIARLMCSFALSKGYSPYASHLLLTQFLDDRVKEDRELGIAAGHSILPICEVCFLYIPDQAIQIIPDTALLDFVPANLRYHLTPGQIGDMERCIKIQMPMRYVTSRDLIPMDVREPFWVRNL